MENKFLSEEEFKSLPDKLKGDYRLAYFKLVDIAPSARDKVNGEAEAISDIVSAVPGYYVSSSDSKELREAMHIFVDRMFDAVEKTHDQEQD